MDDLAERIKASIENPRGAPWFPGLTVDLVARAWDGLHGDLGLTPDTYSTERVLSRNIAAPREIIASLKTSHSPAAAPAISIEALSEESAAEYQKTGVTFYSPDKILHTTILPCIEAAFAIIKKVPSLMRTVAVLVRSLHVIKPADAEHDVSFSEPKIPFSIFVSVPEDRIANDALRVAEAVVHEAMHLQLTLIEREVPIATTSDLRYFSPWRGEHRAAQGVLHALYVFAVIDCFIAELQSGTTLSPRSSGYLKRRRCQIDDQMREIEAFKYCLASAVSGERFVRKLFKV